MAHPVIPQVLEIAAPIATDLGLEVVGAVFQTNHNPPVLRVDVRNLTQDDTSLNDCEKMSIALGEALETSNTLPDAYVLEVSSPGVSDQLQTDRDFIVFKGFAIEITLHTPHKGKKVWIGTLLERTESKLAISQRGRRVAIPNELVEAVQLSNQVEA
ncbi:ribosome maturation factor RimP [Leptothoe sp. ISB3NOV94-8A]|uniref:Ribosome maturation factor RimP n=1 Tax=Adonisia turfae CCMR0081 TaxID=2292702 RepID=A0A6M0RVQ5_9CYAN|nr:ribosome maturation factor RimP [Adonisia turfae]MDV3351357.1 ribosome maturation factor RimP [Leptothoe sp. LEGE 181152]NEZ60186.1 ribosome maturation factor RimP [Adonisia turfae CCMR0081]